MSDIVERLRERANDKFIRDYPLMGEAADEIMRLEDAYNQLRETYLQAYAEIRRLQRLLAAWQQAGVMKVEP